MIKKKLANMQLRSEIREDLSHTRARVSSCLLYTSRLNKKEKRAALKSALTSRVNENKFIVVDSLSFDEIKTKNFKAVMDNLKVSKALVVLDEESTNACLLYTSCFYRKGGLHRWQTYLFTIRKAKKSIL